MTSVRCAVSGHQLMEAVSGFWRWEKPCPRCGFVGLSVERGKGLLVIWDLSLRMWERYRWWEVIAWVRRWG